MFHHPLILLQIVQLILFIVDSGCTKHMTGNLKLLCNFVEKFLGTVHFGNDQFAPILGYGDLNQGNIMIKRVYYVEGLNHNLFSVGQFCDADLEVAFRKSTCFVRDLQGNDLLTGNRGSDLYTISLQETTSSTPICFMAKASPTQAWLWHRRLSHLNFDYITLLSKKDIVTGLPKLKYVKDQLCSSCEMSKAKRSSFKSKVVPSSKGRLNLLHMDLCGPMRVASINGKKYILVIVDDYSRYTWTLFLRSKDETPEVLKNFLTMIQRNLQTQVIIVRTDRGTLFAFAVSHVSTTSAVTYTSVYTDKAFWGANDEEISEGGIPRVIVLGYDELLIQPVALPSSDYIPGPEIHKHRAVPQDEENGAYSEEQTIPPVDHLLLSPQIIVTESESEEDPESTRMMNKGGSSRLSYNGGDDRDDEMEIHLTVFPPENGAVIPPPSIEHYYWARLSFGLSFHIPSTRRQSMAPPAHSSPPPVPSPLLPSSGGRGIDYGFVSTVDAEERRQGIRDVGYGIRDTWVDLAEAVPEIAPMIVGEVNTRVIELAELHEHDTQDLYGLLEDAQDSRSHISQQFDMDSQRVDLLMGDRMTLQEIVWMVEEEAYASREA
ncbi:retrovirus-related pol polyprotein from transposon TNT 1-94 [Tanacetum coccineum]